MRIAVGVIVCCMAAVLLAQGNSVVIKNGADGLPRVQPGAMTISLKGGIAEFSVQADQIQAVRFDPSSTVGCNKQAAAFYWILGTVQCSLAAGVRDTQVKLHVLDGTQLDKQGVPRAKAALARLQKKRENILAGPATVEPPSDYEHPITAELTFQGPANQATPSQATNPVTTNPKPPETIPNPNHPDSSSNAVGWMTLLVMCALAASAWWFFLKPMSKQLGEIESSAVNRRLMGQDSPDELAVLPETLREIASTQASILSRIDRLAGKSDGGDMLRKVQGPKNSPDATCPALPSILGLDGKLEGMAEKFTQHYSGLGRLDSRFTNFEKRLDDLGRTLAQQRESTGTIEPRSVGTAATARPVLTGSAGAKTGQPGGSAAQPVAVRSTVSPELEMEAIGQSQRLQAILNMVPKNYFSADPGESTANGLDRAITDFFRQSSPPKEGLQDCYARVESVATEITHLLQKIDFPELHQKVKPYLNEARQIQTEIEDLLTPVANTMRLRFDVEFYTSAANRDRLIDGIAASLKKQIVKLEKPVEYFIRQFQSLGAAAAQTAADVLDDEVDSTRANQAVQGFLNNLFQAAGVEQILPKPYDRFQAVEHEAVHTEPRPGGPGRERSVSRLVKRGFRRGNEIIRKASVVLYE